jgi:hypothetical protein
MMSTRIRQTSPGGLRQPGRLLGARQLAQVVRRGVAIVTIKGTD